MHDVPPIQQRIRIAAFHVCAWIARILLLAMIIVVPWIYGGSYWQTQVWTIYASLAIAGFTWLACFLSPHRAGHAHWLSIVLLCFAAIAILQTVPLPEWASKLAFTNQFIHEVQTVGLTPASSQLTIPESAPTDSDAVWSKPVPHPTISIDRLQTLATVSVFATAIVSLWASGVLFTTTRTAALMLIVIAATCLTNAVVGLLEAVSWDKWTLLPFASKSTHFSTFVSRNAAPAFLACGVGSAFSLLGLAFRKQRRKRREEYRITYPSASALGRLRNRLEDIFVDLDTSAVVAMIAAAMLMMATFGALSRGGALAAVGAGLATLVLTLGSRDNLARSGILALVMGAIVLSLLSYFELHAPLLNRFDEVNESVYTGKDGRLTVWTYTLHALQHFWMTGSGLGTYHFAILPFHEDGSNTWFYHAENIPLEIVTETGIAGLGLFVLAIYSIAHSVQRHLQLNKERLMITAAIYASLAIGIQSLVDFSLILPGIFLPYCAIIGSFLGRCRRVESEQAYLKTLGEGAFDARRRTDIDLNQGAYAGAMMTDDAATAQPHIVHHWLPRFLLHSAIAAFSIVIMLTGLSSLQGYAAAERIAMQMRTLRALEIDDQVLQAPKLTETIKAALTVQGKHREVMMQVGLAELVLWQAHATNGLDWGEKFTTQQRWDFSNPQLLTLVLRTSNQSVAPLREAIRSDSYGMQLAQDSLQRFEQGLIHCRLDVRAVWGMLRCDMGNLDVSERNFLRTMLSRLSTNNPRAIYDAATLAVQEGDTNVGLALLKQAVRLQPNQLQSMIPLIATKISAKELMEILPEDPVFIAKLCQQLQNVESAKPLQFDLLSELQKRWSQVPVPVSSTYNLDGWRALTWAAETLSDHAYRIQFLERANASVVGRADLFHELSLAYLAAGDIAKAQQASLKCIQMEPENPQYQAHEKLLRETIDQKR